jgi:hypothetical protein
LLITIADPTALLAMYGASDPTAAERTAFRCAEKQYKLYKPLNLKGRSRSRSGTRSHFLPLIGVAIFISSPKAPTLMSSNTAGASCLVEKEVALICQR